MRAKFANWFFELNPWDRIFVSVRISIKACTIWIVYTYIRGILQIPNQIFVNIEIKLLIILWHLSRLDLQFGFFLKFENKMIYLIFELVCQFPDCTIIDLPIAAGLACFHATIICSNCSNRLNVLKANPSLLLIRFLKFSFDLKWN